MRRGVQISWPPRRLCESLRVHWAEQIALFLKFPSLRDTSLLINRAAMRNVLFRYCKLLYER